jgi:hypothetical protein
MQRFFYTLFGVFLIALSLHAEELSDKESSNSIEPLKRHKLGVYLGNSLIREVHNTQTGKEQFVLAPTFGLDYEYWFSHKWAVGTYNEISILSIDVKQDEEEFLKRENVILCSVVGVYEVFPRFAVFAGTGFETDDHHTLWIRFLGVEYAFIKCNGWEVSAAVGYVNKDLYDLFSFGVVIGRRFGKPLASKHH